MIERLGHVFGWAGNLIAALLIAAGAGIWFGEGAKDIGLLIMFCGAGVIAWLVGRALRYIFAGSIK